MSELKDVRIPIMMSATEVEAIDDWAFSHRIRSRAEAIRRLCQVGISYDHHLVDQFTGAATAAIIQSARALVGVYTKAIERRDEDLMRLVDGSDTSHLLLEAVHGLSLHYETMKPLLKDPDIESALEQARNAAETLARELKEIDPPF